MTTAKSSLKPSFALAHHLMKCDENYVFRCHGKDFRECFEQFEKATIFDGMTIYDAESEIEVLFG